MHQDYMGDEKTTLQTAVRIVEGALHLGAVEKLSQHTAPLVADSPPKVRPVLSQQSSIQSDMTLNRNSPSFADVFARSLRKARVWGRRRQRRINLRKERYAAETKEKSQRHQRRGQARGKHLPELNVWHNE